MTEEGHHQALCAGLQIDVTRIMTPMLVILTGRRRSQGFGGEGGGSNARAFDSYGHQLRRWIEN